MKAYLLVKVDFGHKTNLGLFDTHAKALAMQTAEELKLFDSGSLAGVSFYVEEMFVR